MENGTTQSHPADDLVVKVIFAQALSDVAIMNTSPLRSGADSGTENSVGSLMVGSLSDVHLSN